MACIPPNPRRVGYIVPIQPLDGPLYMDGVGGEIHGADVVAVDERALGERAVELRQELSKPGRLRHAISDSTYA